MSTEYTVKKSPNELEALIFQGDKEIAKIEQKENLSFRLVSFKDKQEWSLSNIVDGQRRPFSYTVRKTGKSTHGKIDRDRIKEVFIVKEQLFKYKGRFYMLASQPEGKSWTGYVKSSTRNISRLDNFPYRDLSDVDQEDYTLRHKIKWFRGASVGDARGFGQEERGHRVRLDKELADIGLFITAISYLLYASG